MSHSTDHSFDIPGDLSPFPDQTQRVLRMADALGWHLRWLGVQHKLANISSPNHEKSINIPSTNVNANRAKSWFNQIVRYSDPKKVAEYAEKERHPATAKGITSAMRLAFPEFALPEERTAMRTAYEEGARAKQPKPKPAPPVTYVTDADRTQSTIGDERRSGLPCADCMTPYDKCTDRVFTKGKACCARCADTDTHNVEVVEKVARLKIDPEADAKQVRMHDPDLTIVSERPWIARRSGKEGGKGKVYESPYVTERLWSDGTVDYKCPYCQYVSDKPRSVSSHGAGRADHPKGPQSKQATFPVSDYVASGIHRETSAVNRLASDLLHALDTMGEDWQHLSREELARKVAEAVVEARPDRAPAEPLTPEQIMERIRMLVDGGRYHDMHKQVEAAGAALREANEVFQQQARDLEAAQARIATLQEERRTLASLLSEEGS